MTPLQESKKMEPAEAPKLYEHPANQLIAQVQAEHLQSLGESIKKIEKAVLGCAREIPLYEKLVTIPGIGRILGMTITMEVGEIGRFKTDGDFASYCRTVDATRLSKNPVGLRSHAKAEARQAVNQRINPLPH